MMTSEPIPSPSSVTENAHNILLIVDAESIRSRYPAPSLDASSPTSISDGFIFFATDDSSQKKAKNDSNITLPIDIGRIVHLRGRTVSLIAEYSVVVYDMTIDTSNVLSGLHLEVHPNLTIPAPNPSAPTEPVSQKAHDHFWACTTKASGMTRLEMNFMLVNQQCEAVGYFRWVANIEVTN
jgi:hypothetical protein